MVELCCTYKIIPLQINCDTLLLSYSSHYEVSHHHFASTDQAYSLVKRYQNTHRILILSDSYQEGKNVLKAIEQQVQKCNLSLQRKETFEVKVNDNKLPLLIDKMMEKAQKKSQYIHFKNMLYNIQNQIQSLSKEVVQNRMQTNYKQSRGKLMKIKEKKLDFLIKERNRIHKILKIAVKEETSSDAAQIDQNLLQWNEQFDDDLLKDNFEQENKYQQQ